MNIHDYPSNLPHGFDDSDEIEDKPTSEDIYGDFSGGTEQEF